MEQSNNDTREAPGASSSTDQPFHRMPSQRKRRLWTLAGRAGAKQDDQVIPEDIRDPEVEVRISTSGDTPPDHEPSWMPYGTPIIVSSHCMEQHESDLLENTGRIPQTRLTVQAAEPGRRRGGGGRLVVKHQKSSTETSGLGSSLDWASTETLNMRLNRNSQLMPTVHSGLSSGNSPSYSDNQSPSRDSASGQAEPGDQSATKPARVAESHVYAKTMVLDQLPVELHEDIHTPVNARRPPSHSSIGFDTPVTSTFRPHSQTMRHHGQRRNPFTRGNSDGGHTYTSQRKLSPDLYSPSQLVRAPSSSRPLVFDDAGQMQISSSYERRRWAEPLPLPRIYQSAQEPSENSAYRHTLSSSLPVQEQHRRLRLPPERQAQVSACFECWEHRQQHLAGGARGQNFGRFYAGPPPVEQPEDLLQPPNPLRVLQIRSLDENLLHCRPETNRVPPWTQHPRLQHPFCSDSLTGNYVQRRTTSQDSDSTLAGRPSAAAASSAPLWCLTPSTMEDPSKPARVYIPGRSKRAFQSRSYDESQHRLSPTEERQGHVQFRITGTKCNSDGSKANRLRRPREEVGRARFGRTRPSTSYTSTTPRTTSLRTRMRPSRRHVIEIHPLEEKSSPDKSKPANSRPETGEGRIGEGEDLEERVPTPVKQPTTECSPFANAPLLQSTLENNAPPTKLNPLDMHRLAEYWDHAVFARTRVWASMLASVSSLCMIYALSSTSWMSYEFLSDDPVDRNVTYVGLWRQCSVLKANKTCQATFPFYHETGAWKTGATCVFVVAFLCGLLGIGLSFIGQLVSSLPKQLYYFHSGGEVLTVTSVGIALSLIVFRVKMPDVEVATTAWRSGAAVWVSCFCSVVFLASAILLLLDEIVQELTKLAQRNARMRGLVSCLFGCIASLHQGRKQMAYSVAESIDRQYRRRRQRRQPRRSHSSRSAESAL